MKILSPFVALNLSLLLITFLAGSSWILLNFPAANDWFSGCVYPEFTEKLLRLFP